MMELFAYFGMVCMGVGLIILAHNMLINAIESRAREAAREIVRKTSEADQEYVATRFRTVWESLTGAAKRHDGLLFRVNDMEKALVKRLDEVQYPKDPHPQQEGEVNPYWRASVAKPKRKR